MRRDPSRPAAKHLNDLEVLEAIHTSAALGTYPGDYFPGIPGKVFVAKARKLESQGLITSGHTGYQLTLKGREALGS